MASNAVVEAVKSELEHYPDVQLEIKNGGKHARAVFFKGDRSRFMVLPKTASDWRADRNALRDFRKVMNELGARRQQVIAARGRKGRRTRNSVAAIALNKQGLVVTIPKCSPVLDRFRTKDGKAANVWTVEMRASADLHSPPLIALKQTTMPPGLDKKWGLTRGSPHSSGGWFLKLARSQVPTLTKMVEAFSSVDVQLYEANDKELVFKLPSGTIPTSFRPRHDETPHQPPQTEREEPASEEPAKAEPQANIGEKPIVLQFPKPTVSIEQAIALLNKRKLQLGNKLRFTIREDGFLSAVHRID